MSKREDVVRNLECFYERENLHPQNFNCQHFEECNAAVIITGQEIAYSGAQAHVGSQYGENYKVLIQSLDTGGEADVIEIRTQGIESVEYTNANQHMKGTIEFLRIIFPDDTDKDLLQKFAMTNSAKCSGEKRDKLPSFVYSKCSEYHKIETEILEPDIIIAQGKDAYPWFLNPEQVLENTIDDFQNFLNISNNDIKFAISNTIKRYIRKVEFTNHSTILIHSPHPSARQGQWQVFRDLSLPIIKQFIEFFFKKYS